MKNLYYILLLGLVVTLTYCNKQDEKIIEVKPCLPEGISFTNQAEIDNFQTNYPNCNKIEGDVEIIGDDITNLNGLNVLTAFGGDLRMEGNEALTNLSCLDNLTTIGGSLQIWSNKALTSLTGLDNVTSIGGGNLGFRKTMF